MRDLEIRGAGNLLGPQQSGFIAEVGFDLYCRLLEEAAREIKGEPVVPRLTTKVETDLPAYIPEAYVGDEKQRVVFYKRLIEIQAVEGVDELRRELEDRYGRYPAEVSNLLEFQKIRILSARNGIERIVVKRSAILLEAGKDRKLPMKLMEKIVKTGIGIELKALERPCIKVTNVPEGEHERLETVRKVLLALAAV
jgi:transcription-repair coupling factor (superfamily II helicase)